MELEHHFFLIWSQKAYIKYVGSKILQNILLTRFTLQKKKKILQTIFVQLIFCCCEFLSVFYQKLLI